MVATNCCASPRCNQLEDEETNHRTVRDGHGLGGLRGGALGHTSVGFAPKEQKVVYEGYVQPMPLDPPFDVRPLLQQRLDCRKQQQQPN